MALAPWSKRRGRLDGLRVSEVRGWPVRTLVDGHHAATVHDLLLDERGVPRYLDLRLLADDRHVLLPIGQARADRGRGIVWIPGFVESWFASIPSWDGAPERLSRAVEASLVAAYRLAYDAREASLSPYSGRLDAPPVTPVTGEGGEGQVVPLGSLEDAAIAEGEPDPRGWTVIAADARAVGTIEELLVDTDAMKIRYFICRLDELRLGLDRHDRRIIVPAGHALLETSTRAVLLPTLRADDIRGLPVFTGERIRREVEEELAGEHGPDGHDDAFYDRPRFDPARFFGAIDV